MIKKEWEEDRRRQERTIKEKIGRNGHRGGLDGWEGIGGVNEKEKGMKGKIKERRDMKKGKGKKEGRGSEGKKSGRCPF